MILHTNKLNSSKDFKVYESNSTSRISTEIYQQHFRLNQWKWSSLEKQRYFFSDIFYIWGTVYQYGDFKMLSSTWNTVVAPVQDFVQSAITIVNSKPVPETTASYHCARFRKRNRLLLGTKYIYIYTPADWCQARPYPPSAGTPGQFTSPGARSNTVLTYIGFYTNSRTPLKTEAAPVPKTVCLSTIRRLGEWWNHQRTFHHCRFSPRWSESDRRDGRTPGTIHPDLLKYTIESLRMRRLLLSQKEVWQILSG